MEIIQERLEREFNQTVITTVPNVSFNAYTSRGEKLIVNNPAEMPDPTKLDRIAKISWFARAPPCPALFCSQGFMTLLYIMTFGSFSGFAAVFPLLIKETYGKFPGGPDPLKYAFLGPLIGAGIRAACRSRRGG